MFSCYPGNNDVSSVPANATPETGFSKRKLVAKFSVVNGGVCCCDSETSSKRKAARSVRPIAMVRKKVLPYSFLLSRLERRLLCRKGNSRIRSN
jgi:hypothetical protein